MQSDGADRNVIVCKYLNYQYRRNNILYTIRIPLVHIYLKSSNIEFETVGLVDSGATQTLIPKEIADTLQLDYKEETVDVEGAGATFPTRMAILARLKLLKNVTPFDSYTRIKVLVPERDGTLPYVILGRDYVFRRFDITFHENRQKMTFRKI